MRKTVMRSPSRCGQAKRRFRLRFIWRNPGELSVDPKLLYPAQHFVVMLPKTIQFAAAQGAAYKSMQNPRDPNANVQVAANTQIGDPLGFKISEQACWQMPKVAEMQTLGRRTRLASGRRTGAADRYSASTAKIYSSDPGFVWTSVNRWCNHYGAPTRPGWRCASSKVQCGSVGSP
jgi:hypothetical protein